MFLRCEIELKLGNAWTAYDRMGTADSLIKKIRNLLDHDCKKSKGEMELLSIRGEIGPEEKRGAPPGEIQDQSSASPSLGGNGRPSVSSSLAL